MASTYTPIATTTLGSAQSSVTFSSISGSYTDLVLVCSIKSTAYNGYGFGVTFNSDTGTNYSGTLLQGNGSAASSLRVTNYASALFGNLDTAQFSVMIANIQNYSNTSTYKTLISRTSAAGNTAGAWVSLWRNTAAINNIVLSGDGTTGNIIAAGSTFTLYGIKAA